MANLVVTRKPGEQIAIGDNVVVTIVDVLGCNRVRVMISAPLEIKVDRMEVRQRKEEEWNPNKESSK